MGGGDARAAVVFAAWHKANTLSLCVCVDRLLINNHFRFSAVFTYGTCLCNV